MREGYVYDVVFKDNWFKISDLKCLNFVCKYVLAVSLADDIATVCVHRISHKVFEGQVENGLRDNISDIIHLWLSLYLPPLRKRRISISALLTTTLKFFNNSLQDLTQVTGWIKLWIINGNSWWLYPSENRLYEKNNTNWLVYIEGYRNQCPYRQTDDACPTNIILPISIQLNHSSGRVDVRLIPSSLFYHWLTTFLTLKILLDGQILLVVWK